MKIQGRYAAVAAVCAMLIPLAGMAAGVRADAPAGRVPASVSVRPADALDPVVPDDVQRAHATEIARLRDSVSSAEAKRVLADGVITADELSGLTAGYTRCLAAKGIRWVEPTEPTYAAKADYNTLPTGPVVKNADGTFSGNEEVKACGDRYGYDEIFGLYADMRADPAGTVRK